MEKKQKYLEIQNNYYVENNGRKLLENCNLRKSFKNNVAKNWKKNKIKFKIT